MVRGGERWMPHRSFRTARRRQGPAGASRARPRIALPRTSLAFSIFVGICSLLAACGPSRQTRWAAHNAEGQEAYSKGRYAEAERAYKLALEEAESFGEQDPRFATSLNNLGVVFSAQGKYASAEPLFSRALGVAEK